MSPNPTITFDDFLAVDVRVGRIVDVQPFPKARKPAYQLEVDFGPEIGRRRSSAQLTQNYPAADLLGRQVLAVVNFPPRQIATFFSEVLVLGVPDADGNVVLIEPQAEPLLTPDPSVWPVAQRNMSLAAGRTSSVAAPGPSARPSPRTSATGTLSTLPITSSAAEASSSAVASIVTRSS